MGKVKDSLEKRRIEQIENRFKRGDFDYIYLFTNREAKAQNSDSSFYYQAYGDIDGCISEILIVDINAKVCDCFGCLLEQSELAELVSIRAGLAWAFKEFRKTPIWLWVSSANFNKAVRNRFGGLLVNCNFKRKLTEDLAKLVGKLDIRVDEYSYGSKDMIPVFVEGKSLKISWRTK